MFNVGSKYKILIQVNNAQLAYTAEILEEDEFFIKFVDKFGKTVTFNKKNIVSFEEVQNGN